MTDPPEELDPFMPRVSQVFRGADGTAADEAKRRALESPELRAAVAERDRLRAVDPQPGLRPLVPPGEIARFEAAQARQRVLERAERETDPALPHRAASPASPFIELPMGPGPHAETMEIKRLAPSAVAEAPSVAQPVVAAAARRAERESEPLRPAGVPAPLGRRIGAGVVVGACLLALGLWLGGVLWNRRGPSAVVEIDAGASVVGTMSVRVPASAPSAPVVVSAAPVAASAAAVVAPSASAAVTVPVPAAPAPAVKRSKPVVAPHVHDAGIVAPVLSPDFAQ